MSWPRDDLFISMIIGMAACATAGIAGVAGYAAWDALVAETFSLRKDAWTCTKHHTETDTIYLPVGKVMVPQFTTDIVCDQWTAK